MSRHQPYFMANPLELACPVVRSPTGLNANETRWQTRKELDDLASKQSLSNDNFAVAINSMHLKDVFCDIQSNRGDLHDLLLVE